MERPFKAVKISEHVHWVGAIDRDIRDFHGYLTSRGTTYNAYLILADKITLVDTVKAPFREEMLSRISSIIPPRNITYIVSNHSEMDHSGSLPETIQAANPEKVFASVMGAKALEEHFHWGNRAEPVKNGGTLDLGNMKLSFIETRMLHWPDSMMSYLEGDALLFSQDAFGMHLASSERFADELDDAVLEHEGAKYYANILLPYSQLVTKLLEKMAGLGIPINILAPDHGPVWRKDLKRMPELYSKWAAQKPTMKAVIVYDTMWQSTSKMAGAISDGLAEGGAAPKLMSLKSCHRSDAVTEILDAGALIAGSPTLNNGLLPTVADVLTYLKGLKPRNLVGAAFGSYGWSGEAVGQVQETLSAMGVELAGEGLKTKYVPDNDALARCRVFGRDIARRMLTIQADTRP